MPNTQPCGPKKQCKYVAHKVLVKFTFGERKVDMMLKTSIHLQIDGYLEFSYLQLDSKFTNIADQSIFPFYVLIKGSQENGHTRKHRKRPK